MWVVDYSAYCSLPADVLLYVSEGFMPFLQIFYSEFYRKGSYEQTALEGETTDLLYKAMLVSTSQLFYNNLPLV